MRPPPPFERFIQVPGPNPILVRGEQGAWDEACIECCDVLKEQETYYLYYHGYPLDREKFPRACYRLGVATAPHPLGPWTRHPDNPVLDLGPERSWDGQGVACASILKEGGDRFYLFYSGRDERWSIGLATGPSPVGPWTKAEVNPVMEDFGYVGGVFRHEGKYWLYTEHPIGATGPDYGPISLAHAERPEGPWTAYEGNPVLPAGGAVAVGSDRLRSQGGSVTVGSDRLRSQGGSVTVGSDRLRSQGEWGTWDDGGYSEAEVTLRDGVFHIFYGAARLHPTRILSQESVGYAYSYDGVSFTKFAGNPVAMRERDPGAAAFAEVHHLFEPPLIYAYHTLRYVASDPPSIEDLGVQVLATQSPFCIPMPVLSLARLGPGECSSLDACPTVSLEHIRRCALTLECKFGSAAAAGLRLHVRSSPDGLRYDTADLAAFDLLREAGTLCRRTFDLDCGARFVKLMVANLNAEQPVADVTVTATLKG